MYIFTHMYICLSSKITIGDEDEIITYYILKRYNPPKIWGCITATDSHIAPREKL